MDASSRYDARCETRIERTNDDCVATPLWVFHSKALETMQAINTTACWSPDAGGFWGSSCAQDPQVMGKVEAVINAFYDGWKALRPPQGALLRESEEVDDGLMSRYYSVFLHSLYAVPILHWQRTLHEEQQAGRASALAAIRIARIEDLSPPAINTSQIDTALLSRWNSVFTYVALHSPRLCGSWFAQLPRSRSVPSSHSRRSARNGYVYQTSVQRESNLSMLPLSR